MKLTAEILERYYKGICSEEEKASVERWLDQQEETPDLFKKDFPDKTVWEYIEAAISEKPKKNHRYILKFSVAAAVAAIICLPIYLFLYKSQNNVFETAIAKDSTLWDSIVSGKGLRKQIRLSDGTEVFLNFSAVLHFPKHFDDSRRIVVLSGEAFFKVKKDSAHPFIVQTALGSARDLGTEFDVDAYPSEKYMAVTVTEGKVAFRAGKDNKELILNEGSRGIYHSVTDSLAQTDFSGVWTAWISNNLAIQNMSMSDIAAVLNGRELKSFKFPAKELLAGGTLKLIMGVQPNTS